MSAHSMQALAVLVLALGAVACSSIPARPPGVRHLATSADGLAIAWEEAGQGEPAVVFVHGLCGDRAVWRSTMAACAATRRVIALDLGGHGESGRGRAGWSYTALADDVVAVVAASGAERVILVGHLMGAPVALLATPRLAPRVVGVIAVDGLHDAQIRYAPDDVARSAKALEADFPRALESSYRSALGDVPAAVADWALARALRTERAAAIGLVRALDGFEIAPVLAAAHVPVRAIHAEGSPGTPATALEGLRALADFEALEMHAVGHFPMLERPEEFRALLARWVTELDARAPTRP